MSQLLKKYKAPDLELICRVIEAMIIPKEMFQCSSAVKTWYKDMLNDGYLVTFSKNDVPIEWYDDDRGNECHRLFTGHQTKEWGTQTAYYWERTVKDNEYIHNKMIKTVKAWEEIEQQAKLFLKHNKCIVVANFNTDTTYNPHYDILFNHFNFSRENIPLYNDYLESRSHYYKISDLKPQFVFNQALISDDYDYYRNLTLFAYFKPQSVQFSTFINGKNVKDKVNVGDYWVNYRTDTAYQESEDFLGNKVLKYANHPHISDGRVCAGGWSQAWTECRNLGRIFGWHSGFALFLRRYNSRSPYNQPALFKTNFKLKVEDETFEYQFESPAEAIKVMQLRSRLTGSNNIEKLIPHLKRCKHNNLSAIRYFECLNLLKRISGVCTRELRHANSSKLKHVKEIFNDTATFLKDTYKARDYELYSLELDEKDYFGKAVHNLHKDAFRFKEQYNNGKKTLNPTLKQILLAARGHYSEDENLARTIMTNNQVHINTFYTRIVNRYNNYQNRMFIHAKRKYLKAAKENIQELRAFVNALKATKKDSNFKVVTQLFNDFETKLDVKGQ